MTETGISCFPRLKCSFFLSVGSRGITSKIVLRANRYSLIHLRMAWKQLHNSNLSPVTHKCVPQCSLPQVTWAFQTEFFQADLIFLWYFLYQSVVPPSPSHPSRNLEVTQLLSSPNPVLLGLSSTSSVGPSVPPQGLFILAQSPICLSRSASISARAVEDAGSILNFLKTSFLII